MLKFRGCPRPRNYFNSEIFPISDIYFSVVRLLHIFKVPPVHLKMPPGHYKGLHATSKGHTPSLLIPGKYKQANEFQWCHHGHLTSLIINEAELTQLAIQGFPTLTSYSTPMKAKIYFQTDIFSDPRLQRCLDIVFDTCDYCSTRG